ncbi:MAG: cytochrome ubiquinol oxidase subunit I [Armatimonadetes bacterium]|nr:cytochrome ubiquinol oxidase subunit I [Armatimonadota bacterium]
MHYPWWHVPYLTGPMLIAIVAVLHMFVAHYAVGGGMFLAVETTFAYRRNRRDYLEYLHNHAWFFILITVVYGAITGVGIWLTIGLASPLATEALIHIFIFGWAMEYVTFFLEIASAFAFFYYWGRLAPKTHQAMAWIYAVSAWLSLFFITGITAFMLNPGGWESNRTFSVGFFNPQLVPQVLARTGGALLLSAQYVYLHATFRATDPELRYLVQRRSTLPGLVGAAMVALGGILWYAYLPESSRAVLVGTGVLNVLMTVIFVVTAVVFVMLYLGPYRNPGWLSPGFAILFLLAGFTAIGAGEFVREAVRKPYIVYNVVLGNQIYADEVPILQRNGFLEGGTWTRAYIAARYPGVMEGRRIVEERLLDLPEPEQRHVGEVLFQYHCNNCHAVTHGVSGASQLLRGWTPEMVRAVSREPDRFHFFMPPWSGTPAEAEVLARFLIPIAEPFPRSLKHAEGRE